MKKICFISIVMLFTGALTASAQFMSGTSGISSSAQAFNSAWIGYAPTTMKVSSSGVSISNEDLHTFSLGLLTAKPLQNVSSLLYEVGAIAEWTRLSESESGAKSTLNMLGVRFPLNILFEASLNDITIYPYAGLHAKGYIIAKEKVTISNQTTDMDFFDKDDMGGDTFNRFTLGYQFGVRLGVSQYFVSVGYTADLTNLYKGGDSDSGTATIKSNLITLGIGFQL